MGPGPTAAAPAVAILRENERKPLTIPTIIQSVLVPMPPPTTYCRLATDIRIEYSADACPESAAAGQALASPLTGTVESSDQKAPAGRRNRDGGTPSRR